MFRRLIATSPTWVALPLRLALGAVFIGHGAQKVFGVWGGPGLAKFTAGAAPLGLEPSYLWMGAAAFAELVGGALVLAGLLTRLGALLLIPVMLVAVFGVHWSRGFFQPGGYEYAFTLALMCVSLLISGGGRFSLDDALMDPRNRRR